MKGSYLKTEKHKINLSLALLGHFVSEESKQKNREKHIGKRQTEESKLKKSESLKIFYARNPVSKEKGIKISKAKMGHMVTNETRDKLRKCAKLQWEHNYDKMAHAVFKARKPNKLELQLNRILQSNFPNEWKYVGNGQVWIGQRCPDFININGRKNLIELFGNYWHKPEDEELRKSHFKKFGFDTIVVWESELKDVENLLSKLSSKEVMR